MKRILMVCLGNICRSPLAQGILEHKAKEKGLDVTVDSAGTAAYHVGEAPDYRSVEKAEQYGINISAYRGRHFSRKDFDDFDEIYAMDEYNYHDICSMARTEEEKQKVGMILNKVYPGTNMSVPDPYYGGEEGFENVYQLLDQACDRLIKDLDNG